jgi:AcrR family transcriptional regulator
MLRIQSVALDLFEERGFDAVTIEEIAAASEVSPSSVYRYFGTKEQVVLWDESEALLRRLAAAATVDPVPLAGLRRVIMAALDGFAPEDERRLVRRLRLAATTPSLEQATVAYTYSAARVLEDVLARQLRRPVEDLDVQVFAHALAGGLLGMFHHWQGTDFREPMRDVVKRVFELFFEGLDIVTATTATAVR